jgi:hypothetical protein
MISPPTAVILERDLESLAPKARTDVTLILGVHLKLLFAIVFRSDLCLAGWLIP